MMIMTARMMIATMIKTGLTGFGSAAKIAALLICLTGLSVPAYGQTQTPLERVVALVASQGFEVIEMRRTWLGRIRIDARNGGISREIVINRTTGEILRDYWEEKDEHERGDDDHDREHDDDDAGNDDDCDGDDENDDDDDDDGDDG